MKRWLLLIIALIVLGTSVYLYLPYFVFESGSHLTAFILLIGSLVFIFAAIYVTANFQNRQKVKTLQNRLKTKYLNEKKVYKEKKKRYYY